MNNKKLVLKYKDFIQDVCPNNYTLIVFLRYGLIDHKGRECKEIQEPIEFKQIDHILHMRKPLLKSEPPLSGAMFEKAMEWIKDSINNKAYSN